MTIVHELSVWDYEPWSGAVDTYERICREGKLAALDSLLDELFHNNMTDTELNDLLWFESDSVYEWLGMRTDTEIEEEKQARKVKRAAILELLETKSADEFCNLWQDTLDQDCASCPLYREKDCDDDGGLIANRAAIEQAAKEINDELSDEEDDE